MESRLYIPTLHTFAMNNIFTGSCGMFRFRAKPNVVMKTPKEVDKLKLTSTSGRAKDSRDRDVLLFENEWSIRLACENNEGLELAETANRL